MVLPINAAIDNKARFDEMSDFFGGAGNSRTNRFAPVLPVSNNANFALDFASVGATENILMAATLAEGTTVVKLAAKHLA